MTSNEEPDAAAPEEPDAAAPEERDAAAPAEPRAGAVESSWPSGRDLRRLTRDATDAHTGGSIMEIFSEVYYVIFSAAIALAVALGAVQGLNATLTPAPGVTSIDPSWLAVVAGLVIVGSIVALAGRLGPIGMGGGQASWWLPTPTDRRTLLRPRAALIPLLGAVFGAAGGLLIVYLALPEPGSALGWSVALFALLGAGLSLAVAAGQVHQGNRRARRLRPAVLLGDALMALAPVLGLLVVVLRPGPLAVPHGGVAVGAIAVLAIAVVVLLWRVGTGLDEVSGRELRSRGAVSAYAAGAVMSMDTRELGRALTVSTAPDQRRGSANLGWVRGPVSAIVTGDALVLARSPRHAIQIVVAGCLPLVAVLAGWPTWINLVALIAGAYFAAMATAEGARRAEMAPVLDRHFPLEATEVRRVRAIFPAAVMVLWCAAVFAAWGAAQGDHLGWLVMGVVCAPTFSAGVVRAAYRKPPDWTKPLVTGPMGPVAPGVMTAFARGPDLVVFCLIPLLIAVLALGPTPTLIAAQLATGALALAIATHVSEEKKAAQTAGQKGAVKA